jgi:hypothetical protein
MRDAGKTIVLVTHDMGAVENFCHRAMLIEEGEIVESGEPREVARAYLKTNFEEKGHVVGFMEHGEVEEEVLVSSDIQARMADAWIADASGERVTNLEVGDPIDLHVEIEALGDLERPLFTFQINDANHVTVTGFNQLLDTAEDGDDLVPEGSTVSIGGRIENRLTPGRYLLTMWITCHRDTPKRVIQGLNLLEFVVYGMKRSPGLVAAEAEMSAKIEQRNG